ncbi:MAG: zinc metalloprotease [Actinobacteria bacterium]|nr:zinc metalloprotease [Actinomycetota bacterium]
MHRTHTRARRGHLLAVAAAGLAALAVSASPAAAHNVSHAAKASPSSALCAWNGGGFSSLDALAGRSAARGTGADFAVREKAQLMEDTEVPTGTTGGTSSFTDTIDVYFHVVAAGKTPKQGWVSQDHVDEQISALALSLSGFYGGYDTGFKLRLAATDYTINKAWFDQATFSDEVAMKSALKRGDSTDLNIYSTSGGGYLGWAYYPSIVTSNQYRVLDGVVIHYGSMPGGSVRNYNLGFTASHETGHWLGLAHTFEKGCIGGGDHVSDTPEQGVPTSGCPADNTQDTCSTPGWDPIHNYMDYSYDRCYTQFTKGQGDRMQKQWSHWRLGRA